MKMFYVRLSALACALLISSCAYAGHVYVRSDGPSDGDGKSWATAFNSIDAAIANLQEHPEDTTFWVAAGVYSPIVPYSPSGVAGGAAGDGFSTGLLTFNLPNGVEIYGGFTGCENSPSERPKIANPLLAEDHKCLSQLPNHVVDYGLTVLDGAGSYSWHVVTAGNDIDKTGVAVGLFDLTIKGGYADGPDSGELDLIFGITAVDYAHDSGGGLYARYGSKVDLFNVQFINNSASGVNASVLANGNPVFAGGGAIGAWDEGTVINVENSYFSYNTAVTSGAGGGAISANFDAELNVSDCVFVDNLANRTGGAIRTKDGGDAHISGSFFARNIARDLQGVLDQAGGALEVFQGNLFVDSSTFVDNQGLVGAGAIFFHTFVDDGETYFLDINNCCFKRNSAGPFGGGAILIFGQGQKIGSKATVRNSSFSKNSGGLGGAIYASSFVTEMYNNRFSNNLADAWGGAVAVDNLGVALLFPPLAFADRPVATICDCTFKCNKTRGVQPPPFGFPPIFTPPGILNIFAQVAPQRNNIPTIGTIDQTIQSGGGAVAVLLAGVAKISKSTFACNEAINGTGGGILVGGATGSITDLTNNQTYQTFNYATAYVKDSAFKKNQPNNAQAVDLANVGKGKNGVTLLIRK